MDFTALSMLTVGTKGPLVLPHHTKAPSRKVVVPPPALSEATNAALLADASPKRAMRKPVRSMQKALGGFRANAPAAALAEVHTDDFDAVAGTAHRCFAGNDAAGIDRLVADVRQAAAPGVSAQQSELLIVALSEATSAHSGLARRVLLRMRQGLTIQPHQTRGAGFIDNRLTALAWRTAQKLAATTHGYECARALAGRNWPAGDSGARYAPRVWLQAADHLVDSTRCEADPAAIDRMAQSLADDASATPRAHAAWIVRAASQLWRIGSADGMSAADKGALLAGRQGYFMDGPGTPLAATRSRMAHFLNHTIPYATSDHVDPVPDEHGDAIPVASRRSKMAAAIRPFGYRKSAVAAMRDGVQGASLGTWEKDKKLLNDAMRDVFVALDERVVARDDRTSGSRKLMKDSHAIHLIVGAAERAVLAELSRTGDGASREDRQSVEYGMKFNDDTIGLIAERVVHTLDDTTIERLARLGGQNAGNRDASNDGRPTPREARVRRLLTALRDQLATADSSLRARARMLKRVRKYLIGGSDVLDAEKIALWRRRIGDDVPADVSRQVDAIDRIALGKAITPRGTRTDDFRDAGDRMIDTLEGSGKVVLTDGGVVGASTRGISAVAASFPWLVPRLNLKASRGRQSVLEFSRSTAAYKISFGTQRRNHYEAGGGVQVGHNIQIARGAGNVDIGHEWDDASQRTVDLSIARRLNADGDAYDDRAARTQLKAVNRYLFDNAGRGKSERTLWNELGSRFFDNDAFTVSWNNQHSTLRQVDATVDIRAGVKIGAGQYSARANGVVGGTYRWVRRAELDSVDESGQTRIEGHRVGSGHRVGVHVDVSSSVGDQQSLQEDASDPTDVATVSMLTPNIIGLQLAVHDSFHQAKATLARERGKLQVRSSNADIEFANFDQYKRALRGDPAWMLAFGATPGDPMPTATEHYERVLAAGSEKIEKYLSHIAENRVPNLRFVLRRRLREHAASEADLLDDRITSLSASRRSEARTHEIERLRDRRDALLKRVDSWMPTELLTIQTCDRQVTAGLRFGIQIAAQKGARGEREVAALKLTPREADRLDLNWPRHDVPRV
ncbi:hypothetical protein [Burkholderia sp. AU6039]|uniref:hypothetical protein n=1 Tax=Burkholderia sp. AU6039 TaxID=2015344 RepID=UPI000B7AEEB5|nr:hypothetical protein [Burkholderia sp. AU6039]OXJ06541.1 hypothetical protein CFB39_39080 [Burkholderia sp. AU6039]